MKENYTVIYTSESWMYLNKYKPLAVELLEAWIVFFLLYTPAAMLLGYQGEIAPIIWGLLMILPVFLSTVLKRRIADGKMFFIVNLAIAALIWFLCPSFEEKMSFTLLQVILFLRCFLARREEYVKFWNFSVLAANGVAFFIYFVVAAKLNVSILKSFITLASINNLICLLIYFHVTRRDNLLAWEEDHASVLVDKMKKMSVYVISIAAASLIILNLAMWKSGIFAVMDSLFNGISLSGEAIEPPKELIPATLEASAARRPVLDGGKPSPIINVILTILSVIIMVMLAIAVMYLLWALAMKLKEIWNVYFGRKELGDEKREFIFDEGPGLNIMSQINKVKRVIEDNLDFSNRKKIRHYYKKLIKKYHDKGMETPKYYTAGELVEGIEGITHRPYKEAASIYSKARYSREECSDSDVSNMKKYL